MAFDAAGLVDVEAMNADAALGRARAHASRYAHADGAELPGIYMSLTLGAWSAIGSAIAIAASRLDAINEFKVRTGAGRR